MSGLTSRESDKFMLRLPDGMRDRIKLAAGENNRSMNQEIVAALEEKYPEPEFTAEDFLTFLQSLTEPMSVEEEQARREELNSTLRYFNIDLETVIAGGMIALVPTKKRD